MDGWAGMNLLGVFTMDRITHMVVLRNIVTQKTRLQ